MEKEFKTYDELILLLKERGLSFGSEEDYEYAKNVLEKVGYYNLINGYNKLFLNPEDKNKYKTGASLREIHALYQFDTNLRNIFFKYILTVEVSVKSKISYYFSERHGHKNYLIYENFNTSIRDASEKITSVFAEIQRQIAGRASDPCISHYLTHYGYIPLWVLNNILTLGTISKFYSIMKVPERQCVSKSMGILDFQLENNLRYLTVVRNFCAHGNRLYCFRTKNPLLDSFVHKKLEISKSPSNEYLYGKRDLFAALIALKSMLSRSDLSRMCEEIYGAIGVLDKKLILLKRQDVLNEMGFPADWKKIISIK